MCLDLVLAAVILVSHHFFSIIDLYWLVCQWRIANTGCCCCCCCCFVFWLLFLQNMETVFPYLEFFNSLLQLLIFVCNFLKEGESLDVFVCQSFVLTMQQLPWDPIPFAVTVIHVVVCIACNSSRQKDSTITPGQLHLSSSKKTKTNHTHKNGVNC